MIRSIAKALSARAIERIFRFGGIALLATYALTLFAGEAGRVIDMSAFEAASDRSLWSAERLQAYQRALGLDVEPPVALMEVASVGLFVPVYSDTRELHLNRGAGLIPGMAAPGKGGNLGIAGHRDGYFRNLKDIQIGHAIVMRAGGWRFDYRVEHIEIVAKEAVDSLGDTPDPVLTLVTCFPFYFVGQAPQRFVVRARLHGTSSERKLAHSQHRKEGS
jgi:sortase A